MATAPPLRTAVCFAGAWRDWSASWSRIEQNIIEPLGDVDIYGVSDHSGERIGDARMTVARMRQSIGARFKDGEHLSASHLANVSGHVWPTIVDVQAALGKSVASRSVSTLQIA